MISSPPFDPVSTAPGSSPHAIQQRNRASPHRVRAPHRSRALPTRRHRESTTPTPVATSTKTSRMRENLTSGSVGGSWNRNAHGHRATGSGPARHRASSLPDQPQGRHVCPLSAGGGLWFDTSPRVSVDSLVGDVFFLVQGAVVGRGSGHLMFRRFIAAAADAYSVRARDHQQRSESRTAQARIGPRPSEWSSTFLAAPWNDQRFLSNQGSSDPGSRDHWRRAAFTVSPGESQALQRLGVQIADGVVTHRSGRVRTIRPCRRCLCRSVRS